MTTQAPDLTTTFTPAKSCFQYYKYQYTGDELTCLEGGTGEPSVCTYMQLGPSGSDAGCFPSSLELGSKFYYSPGVCPSGFEVACSSTFGDETRATCCPSSFSCQTEAGWPWYSTDLCTIVIPRTVDVIVSDSVVGGDWERTTVRGAAANAIGIPIRWHSSDFESTTTTHTVRTVTISRVIETNSSTDTSASDVFKADEGLGMEAKIGIGIGVGFAALAAFYAIGWFVLRARRAKQADLPQMQQQQAPWELDSRQAMPPVELPSQTGRNRSKEGGDGDRTHKSDKNADDPGYEPPRVSRNESEKNACRKREGHKCLFTRMAQGEVTHILPFTWNDTDDAIHATRAVSGALYTFFSDDLVSELHELFADPADPGSSDKWWNMIYMNAQLHIFWGTAGFGLHCSGIGPHIEPEKADNLDTEPLCDITIKFHWLQHRDVKPTDRIVLEGNDNGFMEMTNAQTKYEEARSEPSKHSQGNSHIDAMAMDTRTTIISGDEFTLTMPKEDAFKCKRMLDVQWHLIRIAAMCGAAEYPELLPDYPDYHGWARTGRPIPS
ncbi:hypothetical protein NW768_004685 [Fusarium equiseti]|uniref:HNH nuclease domain-containing protein n=1 Tax=Fusarium equiseti TaxID=61235 RepID=A0ABQ8RGW7_FUSEQ|nr:hypothetical protein NW768_004685 [Fusarium equiseti]